MSLVLLVPLLAYSHLVSKVCSYLVYCLGEITGYASMVQSAGSPMSPAVALRFRILGFLYIVLFYLWIVSLFLSELVVPAVAWKSPKLSLVLEVGSDIM